MAQLKSGFPQKQENLMENNGEVQLGNVPRQRTHEFSMIKNIFMKKQTQVDHVGSNNNRLCQVAKSVEIHTLDG